MAAYLDFIVKSRVHLLSFTTVLLLFFTFSQADAQIHVFGGAKIVGAEQIHLKNVKTDEVINSAPVIYMIGRATVTNFDRDKKIQKGRKLTSDAQVAIRKSAGLRKALAVKERVSESQKVLPVKKSTIHYKPFDNPERFSGAKNQHKTFNLPTEHPSKILAATQQQVITLKDFSLEKTKILTADFFNVHTFSFAFCSRPPPVKV